MSNQINGNDALDLGFDGNGPCQELGATFRQYLCRNWFSFDFKVEYQGQEWNLPLVAAIGEAIFDTERLGMDSPEWVVYSNTYDTIFNGPRGYFLHLCDQHIGEPAACGCKSCSFGTKWQHEKERNVKELVVTLLWNDEVSGTCLFSDGSRAHWGEGPGTYWYAVNADGSLAEEFDGEDEIEGPWSVLMGLGDEGFENTETASPEDEKAFWIERHGLADWELNESLRNE